MADKDLALTGLHRFSTSFHCLPFSPILRLFSPFSVSLFLRFFPFSVTLQVCREFQRGSCTRQPSECRYAHPPDNVTVDTSENCVTVCMDYIKGKCTRDSCRYFHPPPHLQVQIKACQQRANAAAAAQAHALVW